MSGVFISATGTGVGKTFITCQLLQWGRQRGWPVSASKPLLTGWPGDHEHVMANTDTGHLLKAQAMPITLSNIEATSPWRFTLPLTPSVAMQKEGRMVFPKMLIDYAQRRLVPWHWLEGVGGIMSPLVGNWTSVDWLEALHSPCLLIAGAYLGTLTHTLTAVEVLMSKKIDLMGVIVNEAQPSEVPLADTVATLRACLPCLPIWPFPHCQRGEHFETVLINETMGAIFSRMRQFHT